MSHAQFPYVSVDAHHGGSAPVPVTVVVAALNEGSRIESAIAALGWADEVIVADGGSTDATCAVAHAAGARVVELAEGTIGKQRNAGIAAARNEWILALDVDERVTERLVEEMRTAITAPGADAYRINYRNFYLGRELRHGHWGSDSHVRLFRRGYRYTENRVHERVQVSRETGTLEGHILHHPYRDLQHHLQKMVRYARWGAEDLHERGRRAGPWELLMRPGWRFFREFVLTRGYREGSFGLLMAGLSATSTFLKYAFLYAMRLTSRGT